MKTRHYAHVDCPGYCRLREEHDHRRDVADGRRDPARGRLARPPGADARARPALAKQVLGVKHVVAFVDKVDVADPELDKISSSMRGLSGAPRGARLRGSLVVRGSALAAIRGDRPGPGGRRPDGSSTRARPKRRWMLHFPRSGARSRVAVPDAGRGRVHHRGARHGRHRARRARRAAAQRLGGDRRRRRGGQARVAVVTRHRSLPQGQAGGAGRRERRAPAPRRASRDEVVRGPSAEASDGAVLPHAEGEAELYVLTEKEGGLMPRRLRHGLRGPQFFFGTTGGDQHRSRSKATRRCPAIGYLAREVRAAARRSRHRGKDALRPPRGQEDCRRRDRPRRSLGLEGPPARALGPAFSPRIGYHRRMTFDRILVLAALAMVSGYGALTPA